MITSSRTGGIDQASARVADQAKKGLNSVVILVVWSLWNHRNRCVFDGLQPSLSGLLSTIRDELHLWHLAGAQDLLISSPCSPMVSLITTASFPFGFAKHRTSVLFHKQSMHLFFYLRLAVVVRPPRKWFISYHKLLPYLSEEIFLHQIQIIMNPKQNHHWIA